MPRRNSLLRPKSKTKVGALADGIQSMKLEGLADKLTFEQLLDLELMRTELFEKAHDFDQFKIAHSFVGTILPCLLTSPLSWAMAFMYILLRCFLRYEVVHLGNDLPMINSIVTSIVGGFMSFFLVFFVSQAYNRFMAQYNHSKNIVKCITRTTLLSRSSLPYAEALRLVRYLNAAHVVGYVALSKTYTMENLFNPMIARYHLLNETEIERLKAIGLDSGPGALREMITWVLDIIYRAYDDQYQTFDDGRAPFEEWKFASHPRRVDFISLQMLINNVIEFNGNFSDLFNFQEQTFPFSYMHLLVLINACYLILITYTIATYIPVGNTLFPDFLGAFILFCNLIFVTGMREIGGHMIDPYGSDVTDLPIISYIQSAVKSSLEILHGQRLPPSDLETELQIHAKRPKLRPAFLREPTLHMPSPMKAIMNDDQQGNTSFTTNSKEDNDLSNDVELGNIRNAEVAIRYDKTL